MRGTAPSLPKPKCASVSGVAVEEAAVPGSVKDFDEKTEKFDNDYQTFEISTVENSPKQISEIIYYLENFKNVYSWH